jgi:hypothetical protein
VITEYKTRAKVRKRPELVDTVDAAVGAAAEDRAWRIHSALADWTGKVDTKATFCFTLESAALVVVANLTSDGRLFDVRQTLAQKWSFTVGVALLVAGVLCAAFVVIPRMNRVAVARNWKDNTIYFGHLRLWEASTLEKALREDSILPSLSVQLVAMSKIAWRKHLIVQWSLILGLAGVASLGVCTYLLN